jgi:pectinesterase
MTHIDLTDYIFQAMQLSSTFLSTICLGTTVVGAPTELRRRASRTGAPAECLNVGSSGTYSTIGDALDALSSSSLSDCIYVASGTYEEQLTIDYAGTLTMYGETSDTGTYKENTVTITHTISLPDAGTLDKSATANVVSDGSRCITSTS